MDDFERWAREQRVHEEMADPSGAAVELSIPLMRVDAGTAVDAETGGEPMLALRLWVDPGSLPEGMTNPISFHISTGSGLGAVQAMTAALESIMKGRQRG